MDDLISRKAAIDALDKEYRCTDQSDDWDGLKTAMLIIENLPSAQPERKSVTINADSNETKVTNCNYDTIYRQDAIDAVGSMLRRKFGIGGDLAEITLAGLPAVQPERKRGKWIVWNGMDIPENHGKHICSECGEFAPIEYDKPIIRERLTKFCPNCGSYNGGEQE